MENKEKIYDEQIAPLMNQIIEICRSENIPMFVEFQYSDSDFRKTLVYPNVDGRNVTMRLYDVLSTCRIEEGINIDDFFLYLTRNFPNSGSMVMRMLGKEPIN